MGLRSDLLRRLGPVGRQMRDMGKEKGTVGKAYNIAQSLYEGQTELHLLVTIICSLEGELNSTIQQNRKQLPHLLVAAARANCSAIVDIMSSSMSTLILSSWHFLQPWLMRLSHKGN